MRTLKELYKILYEFIKDKQYISGLCSEIYSCYFKHDLMTEEEENMLYNNFLLNRPSEFLHSEFYNNSLFHKQIQTTWWWKGIEDQNPVNRKAFVKHLINNHIS